MKNNKTGNTIQSRMVRKEFPALIGIQPHRERDKPGGANRSHFLFKTIFRVMIDALRRNEEINIPGLGIFCLWERPKTRHGTTHFYNQRKGIKKAHPPPIVETFPATTYVHFTPDPSILEALNADRLSRD